MIDYRLKFPDEATAKAALPSFTHAFGENAGKWVTANHRWTLDPIGPMVLTPAVIDPVTMQVVTPAVIDENYHVNIRLLWADPALTAEIEATGATLTPSNPRRVWA